MLSRHDFGALAHHTHCLPLLLPSPIMTDQGALLLALYACHLTSITFHLTKMSILERRVKDCKTTSPFLTYAKNITSQGGEDGVIAALFQHLGGSRADGRGYCVDIGAWDGKHWSNTFTLLNDQQWGGMLIEADPERASELKRMYEDRPEVSCCDRLVELSGPNALTKFLTLFKVDPDFDFLSIDVDGADYHLWKSLGDEFTPRVVCVEFNPSIPNHIVFIQEDNIQIQQGSSLLALTELGQQLALSKGGYQLVCTTTFNAFFVRKDLMHLLPPTKSDYSIHSLHSAAMVTDIFQTYDGHLKLSGPQKLLWHRNAINAQKIQPLSKKQQIYPFAPPINTHYLAVESHIDTMVTVLSDLLNHDFENTQEINDLSQHLNSVLTSLCAIYEVPDGHNKGKSHTFFFDAEALILSVMLSTKMVSMLQESEKMQTRESSGLTTAIDLLVFQHALNVSNILTNKGDREVLNDIAHARDIYKQALNVIVVASLQDKHTLFPYCDQMLEVTTRLTRCAITKSTDHLYETVFWQFFSKLVQNSSQVKCEVSDTAASGASSHELPTDMTKILSNWQSKVSSRLISMGVDKRKLASRHFSDTTLCRNMQGLHTSPHAPDEMDANNCFLNDDMCDLFSRANGRKLSRMLRNEHVTSVHSQNVINRLQQENFVFRISTVLLLGISGACIFQQVSTAFNK